VIGRDSLKIGYDRVDEGHSETTLADVRNQHVENHSVHLVGRVGKTCELICETGEEVGIVLALDDRELQPITHVLPVVAN